MWRFGGLLVAALTASVVWWLVSAASQALPADELRMIVGSTAVLAALVGFLVGSAILSRASRGDSYIRPFATLAGAVGFGLLGAGCALALTIGYLNSYGTWPDGLVDRVLYVLAYPAFTALGGSLGAIFGMACGAILGGMLTLMTPGARRERPS